MVYIYCKRWITKFKCFFTWRRHHGCHEKEAYQRGRTTNLHLYWLILFSAIKMLSTTWAILSNQSTKILKDNQLTAQFRHWVCRFERKKSWRRIRCCNRCIDLSIFLLLTWRLLNFEKNLQLSLSNNTKTWIWPMKNFADVSAISFLSRNHWIRKLLVQPLQPWICFLEFLKFFAPNLPNTCWFWNPSRSTMVLFCKNWAPGVFSFKIG